MFMGSQKFSGDLAEDDGGNGGGGVEVPMEKMRVERNVQEKTKKMKRKKETMSRVRLNLFNHLIGFILCQICL